MKQGFRAIVDKDELNKIIRKYKQAKKYMRSSLYTVKTMDGTENYISGLIKEAQDDPPVV